MEALNKTIGEMFDDIALRHSNHEALVHTELGVRYNYSILSWQVRRVAKGLLKIGVSKGDGVALWAGNIPEWIISALALAKIGGIMVPIDPGAGKEDLRFILDQSECKSMIMANGLKEEEYVDLTLEVMDDIPSLKNVVVIAEKSYPGMIPWPDLANMGDGVDEEKLTKAFKAVRAEDPAAIMYTSGTTGKPKGAVLDHLGLTSKSIFSAERQGLNVWDRLVLFFPLFHMFGNTCIALTGLLTGCTIVMPCATFEPSRVLHAISKEKCTAVYGSPSMFISLLDHPEFQMKEWKSVTKGTIGGAPCPMELMRRLVEDVGVSGITVGYGITEASSWITMTEPDDPLDLRVSTIGTPLPCSEVRIVDYRTGEKHSANEQGEVCTRGFLMKGYHKMPGATAAAIDRDGWFHTGDLGRMDQKGYVKITGRIKEVIVREGIEIYPVEVEETLYRLNGIAEAQVFGFPHSKKGQEVAAWVKLKEGSDLSIDALAEYTREQLGEEKAPSYFKVVTDFPMTRSGKVQKFRLSEMAESEYGRR